MLTVDIRALRIRTNREIADLGAEPPDAHERAVWRKERHAVVILVAELADHDAELLRRAATGAWLSTAVRDLLLDAAQECG